MKQGFCSLSSVPMRHEPDHCSEMVNQLLFGDTAEIVSVSPGWFQVRALFDGYTGWVSDKQLEIVEEPPQLDYVVPSVGQTLHYQGRLVFITPGSSCCREWLDQSVENDAERPVLTVAKQFLGVPYLWGGRTVLGIDCSGLAQVVYKICGITLPRDASQQVSCGTSVSIKEARVGDLAFFANPEGRIVHVGIVADDNAASIIHASGCVRLDRLDNIGIFNSEKQSYSHRLADIRRVINVCLVN